MKEQISATMDPCATALVLPMSPGSRMQKSRTPRCCSSTFPCACSGARRAGTIPGDECWWRLLLMLVRRLRVDAWLEDDPSINNLLLHATSFAKLISCDVEMREDMR